MYKDQLQEKKDQHARKEYVVLDDIPINKIPMVHDA
jgi:hypothetical protein